MAARRRDREDRFHRALQVISSDSSSLDEADFDANNSDSDASGDSNREEGSAENDGGGAAGDGGRGDGNDRRPPEGGDGPGGAAAIAIPIVINI